MPRRSLAQFDAKPITRSFVWPDKTGALPRVTGAVIAAARLTAVILWTLAAALIQAVLLNLPGRAKVVFARVYWAVFATFMGVSVRVVGAPVQRATRRVVYACNHCSWLDIPVLGGRLEACFVAKEEIAGWPGISLIARLGRTVFVSRTRSATGRERDGMQKRLVDGDNLLLFPEGTSSDGGHVLPFRSAFFAVATQGEAMPLVQPVSVVYDRLAGLPTRRSTRSVFAWYGDMNLMSHVWRVAQCHGMRVTVLFHPPLDPADFPSRKALAQAAWHTVAGSAAALRQDREAAGVA